MELAREAWTSSLGPFLGGRQIVPVFQPIVRFSAGSVIGYEALARVTGPAELAIDEWFDLAAAHDVRDEFELACVAAIATSGSPPDDTLLFINLSASLLEHPAAQAMRDDLPTRLVMELTEREAVEDYERLRSRIAAWKESGVRFAIDDTGSGWATLRHVVQLHPDFIKLDRSLISGLDRDRNCRALVSALAAFARESGATVIAEGVERVEELEVLRDCDIDLGQGWLFALPGSPWAEAAVPERQQGHRPQVRAQRDRTSLTMALGAATRPEEACDVVASHLFRRGGVMPSVYLERGGVLRCQAQRGLWQVLDGMPPNAGVTGRTFATGEAVVLHDVRHSQDYLEAIPGVVSECCAPIVSAGKVVGSLNIESFVPLTPVMVSEVSECARLLGERLEAIGTPSPAPPHQRLARHAAALSELLEDPTLLEHCVTAAIEVSGMDSAALALTSGSNYTITGSAGPLAGVLTGLDAPDLGRLAHLVDRVASCYTAGDAMGAGFVGTDSLRAAGARAVAVVPLVAGGHRLGIIIAASMLPAAFDPSEAETFEILGAQVASCLDRARLLRQLRDATERDALTGLHNRAAFDEQLTALLGSPQAGTDHALLLADVDRFKAINDRAGHPTGDEALRLLGATIAQALGADACAFRVGGDEFAALFPVRGADDALDVGRHLVRAASEALRNHGGAISVGIALIGTHDQDHELLARADRALYHAKRNRIGVSLAASPLSARRSHLPGSTALERRAPS